MPFTEKTKAVVVYSADATRELQITDDTGTFNIRHKNAANSTNQPISMTATNITLTASSNITLSGTLSANLNSIKGQLITMTGERNGNLTTAAAVFSMGDSVAPSSSFGFMIPCNVKLKKFVYSSSQTGTALATTTRICFRLRLDGTAQNIYAYCDFSNTTNGNVANKRFCNKFSSSSTSQIDYEPSITSTYGISLEWFVITNTLILDDNTKHRITFIMETIDDL